MYAGGGGDSTRDFFPPLFYHHHPGKLKSAPDTEHSGSPEVITSCSFVGLIEYVNQDALVRF